MKKTISAGLQVRSAHQHGAAAGLIIPGTRAGSSSPMTPALCAFVFLAAAAARPCVADQVLQIHANSLTTYRSTAQSAVQDVRPLHDQRAVNLDGTLRLGSTFPIMIAGNPNGEGWNGQGRLGDVRLDTGTYVTTAVDLALPAEGFSWVIARSYNCRQLDSTPAYVVSDGYQGKNWFQMSQPEIVLYEDGGDNAEDIVYMILGADRFIELKRQETDSNLFQAVNGAAGVMVFAAGATNEPDTYTYHDPTGKTMTFFGFDGDAGVAAGQMWKVADAAGNVAFVGDASTGSTAITNGFNGSGQIIYAFDPSDRRFTYTYGSGRLTQVKAETKTGGTWFSSPTGVVEVGRVDYTYYGAESFGEAGDLKLVTTTTPLTDSGIDLTRQTYYRYYEGTYHATNNPGLHHQIEYIYESEGLRQQDWAGDNDFDGDFLTETSANLKDYAAANYKYEDTDLMIVSVWFNGDCGCGGSGADGVYSLAYGFNGSDGAGYDTDEWRVRAVVERPDDSYLIQYFDEVGQPMSRVITDGAPTGSPNYWATAIIRNSAGQITEMRTPANATAYTHSTGAITASSSVGLIRLTTRVSSGDLTGFPEYTLFKTGTSGNAFYESRTEYDAASCTELIGGGGGITLVRPLVSKSIRYIVAQHTTAPTAASDLFVTEYDYAAHGSAPLALKSIETLATAVATSRNGSGLVTSTIRYLRLDGTTAFSGTTSNSTVLHLAYTLYENGVVTKRIDDAQTDHGSDFASGDDPSTDFGITETSDGVRRITTMAYDAQGRPTTTTEPDGNVMLRYYSELADERAVMISYPKFEDLATDVYYSPASYSVSNHAGQSEFSATIEMSGGSATTALASHIDETDDDPITALGIGSIAHLSTSQFNVTGTKRNTSRVYFSIPGSGVGTEGTHYDETDYAYDGMGRQFRVLETTGTIHRSTFDAIGRSSAQYIGTNDNDGGSLTGGTSNMVKVAETEYDSGSAGGNSLVTKQTVFVVDGASDRRDTTFIHDVRGRTVVVVNPQAPHSLTLYDNMGRATATGLYSSSSGLDAGDDPTSLTTNRVALSRTYFDDKGQVYKATTHKIDASDGSDDDSLETLTWYDPEGRTIKVDGSQLTKTRYDRLGRTTHQFILAVDNDTASTYTDVWDSGTLKTKVNGDIVLEEHQSVYESTNSDNVLMSVSIARHHDDYGGSERTGELDTNADTDDLLVTAANVKGRVSITAMWYDVLDRVTDTVQYGTNGIIGDGTTSTGNFDRDGLSVPSRSDTALRTTTVYDDDGSVLETEDPKAIKTRFTYDALGRQTGTIRNYVNGVPSSATGDDDLFTRYVYVDGLQTEIWVDVDGDNVQDAGVDEVTRYVYGVTKGAGAGDSAISSGNLLHAVIYPDSDDPTNLSGNGADTIYDRVEFAYNAQGQVTWHKDQAANIIETNFDTAGRETHRRATTVAGGFDDAVERISTVYDTSGRVSTVTQYDDPAVGSGNVVDQVQYSYDGWSNLTSFAMDRNSAIVTSTDASDGYYDIDYTYAKSTAGRNTLRKSTMVLPEGSTLTYEFLSTNGLHDADASRVTRVKVATTAVATYAYNGLSNLVGTSLPQPDVFMTLYDPTDPDDYDRMDNFGRITQSKWTKDLATDVDFYHTSITWDRGSNVTRIEDNIHTGFDVLYTNDDTGRLTNATEGTWNGSSITSETRQQDWTLDQVGNWSNAKLDLDGDNNWNETNEYNDTRTHDVVNQLNARNMDSAGGDEFTLTYDGVGNLTDDGQAYEYVYDVWGRLRKVKNTSNQNLIAEYWYNGLGFRITFHEDADSDQDVDANDPKYHLIFDERWRLVATYRADDDNPKEVFVSHQAGLDGSGSSSYIDSVILRQRDANSGWTSAADGTMEERRYYCQNWRNDVSAMLTSGGLIVEWAKYSAYGVPFGLPGGDTDSDGACDATDITQIQTWIDAPAYDVRGDIDLDGDVDSTDKTLATNNYQGTTSGWDVLSAASVANRVGYAGYQKDINLDILHVRNRVLELHLGRWTRRDPLGYVDGMSLYEYVNSQPWIFTDVFGLASNDCEGPLRWNTIAKRCQCTTNGQFVDTVLCCSFEKGARFHRRGLSCYCILPGGVERIVPGVFCAGAKDEDTKKTPPKKPKKRWWKRIPVFEIIGFGTCVKEYNDCLNKAEDDYLRCYGVCGTYLPEDRQECYSLCDRVYNIDWQTCVAEYLVCMGENILPF